MGNCCSEPTSTEIQKINIERELTSAPPRSILPFTLPRGITPTSHGGPDAPQDATYTPRIPEVYLESLKRPCITLPPFIPKTQTTPNNNPYLGPYLYNKGGVYAGQYKNGLRHGHGVQIWPDGSYYEGQWENDVVNGEGRLVAFDGDFYEGQWSNGKTNGKGVYYHPNGAR